MALVRGRCRPASSVRYSSSQQQRGNEDVWNVASLDHVSLPEKEYLRFSRVVFVCHCLRMVPVFVLRLAGPMHSLSHSHVGIASVDPALHIT